MSNMIGITMMTTIAKTSQDDDNDNNKSCNTDASII